MARRGAGSFSGNSALAKELRAKVTENAARERATGVIPKGTTGMGVRDANTAGKHQFTPIPGLKPTGINPTSFPAHDSAAKIQADIFFRDKPVDIAHMSRSARAAALAKEASAHAADATTSGNQSGGDEWNRDEEGKFTGGKS